MLLYDVALTHRRGRRVCAISVLVAVLVTGCTSTIAGQAAAVSGSSGETLEVFDQAQPPELGRCLDTVRGGSDPLGPPPTLACSDPHGGEIAKVVDVPAALDGDYPTEEVLDSDAWGDLLYGSDGCGDFELANSYLGGREQDNLLVDVSAYLPKRIAWEAGARWLACVVEYQTDVFEDANAPGLMAQAMHGTDADSYRECWFGPELVYDLVPCSQPHEAEPIGDSVSPAEGTPYPTDPLARAPLVEACADAVVDYLEGEIPNGYVPGVYLPSEEDWPVFPEVDCVILDSSGRRVTGSAVDA